MIDFLWPSREIAFRFHLDVQNQQVVRSTLLGNIDLVESFGGFVDLNGSTTFEFYKTEHSWRVSMVSNGVAIRFPWFDFPILGMAPLTHVSVHDGFQNVEVVQSRPMCTTPCLASECL